MSSILQCWILGIFKCFTDFHCIAVWIRSPSEKISGYRLLFCNDDWSGRNISMQCIYLHCVHIFIWMFPSEHLFSNLEEELGNWGSGSHSNSVFYFTRNKQVNFQSSHICQPHHQHEWVPIVQYSVSSYHCSYFLF